MSADISDQEFGMNICHIQALNQPLEACQCVKESFPDISKIKFWPMKL